MNTILRMENLGQIYHKHNVRKILNRDMAKALEQDSGKNIQISIKNYF